VLSEAQPPSQVLVEFAMQTLLDVPRYLRHRDPRLAKAGDEPPPAPARLMGLFALAFFGSLVLAAIATPAVFSVAGVAEAATGLPAARAVLESNVPKIFTAIRWVGVLAVLPFVLRAMNVRSVQDLGLALDRTRAARAMPLLLAGLAIVVVAVALQMMFGVGVWRSRAGSVAADLASSLAIGFGAGVVELLVFCGLILRLFYGGLNRPWLAMFATAAFYAFTHIKAPASIVEGIAHAQTSRASASLALWTLLGPFAGLDPVRLAGLFAIGLACAALTLRTASLWPGIWLYAGLICGKQLAMKWWIVDARLPHRQFGTEQLLDGVVPVMLLLALAVAIIFWPGPAKEPAAVDPGRPAGQ